MKQILAPAAFLLSLASATMAAAADLPESKQTGLGLYLSASEAAGFMAEHPSAIMIDVRTPEEIDETGIADEVDALIPLAIVDKSKRLVFNPDFIPGIAKLVQDRGIGADHPIVIICRSGNRSAQAVDTLSQYGFTQLYTVTDGYEGDRARTGPTAGQRDVNGWKNAGLPWHSQKAASCAPAREGGAC